LWVVAVVVERILVVAVVVDKFYQEMNNSLEGHTASLLEQVVSQMEPLEVLV
jgi:hypothetical protein